MKPKDKERLVKCRPTLLHSLDVDTILPMLRREGVYSKKDEYDIMGDPRRRNRVIKFLDIMEKKRTEGYFIFLDILEQRDPPLFLMLTDEEFEGNPTDMHLSLSNELNLFERARDFLIKEIDAEKLLPLIHRDDILSNSEKRSIAKVKDLTRRNETFLDLLETKGPETYDVVLDAIGETYPHVYLALKGDNSFDDDDDLDDW